MSTFTPIYQRGYLGVNNNIAHYYYIYHLNSSISRLSYINHIIIIILKKLKTYLIFFYVANNRLKLWTLTKSLGFSTK